MSPAEIAAKAPTCENCVHVRTFKPRPDEQERYGFGNIGYGCTKLNYEGYTKQHGWCPSFYDRAELEKSDVG